MRTTIATSHHLRHSAALAVLSAWLGSAACARAPGRVSAPPRPPATHAEGLERAFTRLAMHGLSGSALFVEDGQVRLHAGFGLADRAQGTAATAATRYDVGSLAKTFTAAAVMRLVAQGRLSVDQPLSSLLSEVPVDKRSITLHQLLTHSAGFPLDAAGAGIGSGDSTVVFVRKAMAARLVHVPGAAYAYSNLGYGLLAIIVERVSGQPFRRFVDEEFIAPLGLRATSWWGDSIAMALPGVATGYEFSDREDVLTPEPPLLRGARHSLMWGKFSIGAGGLVSSVGDMHRWFEELRGGRVLPDSLTRLLFSVRAGTPGNQGYGWTIVTRPGLGLRIQKGGARTGFTSLVVAYPDKRASLIYALNQSQDAGWQTVLARSVERVLSGVPDTLPPATIAPTRALLERFTGQWPVAPDARVRISVEDGVLIAGAEGQAAANTLLSLEGAAVAAFDSLNAASPRILRAALRGDSTDAAFRAVADGASLRDWTRARIQLRDTGNLVVLGTVPHPSGPGRAHTFVRAGRGETAPTLRLIWENGRVIAWGDGIRWPAFARFRLTSDRAAVAFTPRVAGWTSLELSGAGPDTRLSVVHVAGARSAEFRRVAR